MTESEKHINVNISYVSDWEYLEEGLNMAKKVSQKEHLLILNMTLQHLIKKLKNLYEEKNDMEKRSKDLHEK